jgi:alkylation response protein AidB-like acyl-CoA dehydrogenase
MTLATASLIDRIRELHEPIRALGAQIERDRQLPAELVARLAELGVFRMAAPRSSGGLEQAPAQTFEVFEELARADGSVGWSVMIAAGTSVALGYLGRPVAEELQRDPGFLIAGVAAPMGRAVAVPGGYRVTGRWPFASASRHATALVGGCLLMPGAPAPAEPAGAPPAPQVRHVVLAPADLTIHDTWDATGLSGTGSHDIEACNVFVPEERMFVLFGPPIEDGALYRFPVFGLLSYGIAAVALGIARGAVDELERLVRTKKVLGTDQPLATSQTVRLAVAEAEAALGAGRAFLLGEIAACWDAAQRGAEITLVMRARLRLAVVHATGCAAQAVDASYRAAGGTAVYAASALQRQFRDVHVATQHAMVHSDVAETVGGVLLDQPVNTTRL